MKAANLTFLALVASTALMTGVIAHGARAADVAESQAAADDPFSGVWAQDVLERLVVGPTDTLDKGDLARAEQQVEAMIARAPDAAERGRIMTAWAIALMTHHSDKGDALPWLRRAVGEARQAYPADSRLLAMSLGDYGSFEVRERGARTSPEAEDALVEAVDIQRRILGPGHVETLSTSVSLGTLRGLPARTQGDPARIAAAARLFEPLLTANRPAEPGDLDQFFLDWTDMLIANGQPDAACAVLQKTATLGDRLRMNLDFIRFQTGIKLRDAGFTDHAAPLIDVDRYLSDGPAKASGCGS
ncbi:MAG TPA: hypothetical protein VN018_10060 [Brevundimonas sp.]|nr:hypothetical protein [Brevundimonas sp.]